MPQNDNNPTHTHAPERLAKSGMSGDEDVSALAKENYELKMLVDEKASELEDRNVLLVKARTATLTQHNSKGC